ncbi:MAG: hypothetical protein R3E87_23820 [Burkholderiaceae bacterium]
MTNSRVILTITALLPSLAVAQSSPSHAGALAATGARTGALAEIIQRLGRAPDASEDGGACGGIMIHDWHAEGLRVITQGNQVQSMSQLPRPAAD